VDESGRFGTGARGDGDGLLIASGADKIFCKYGCGAACNRSTFLTF